MSERTALEIASRLEALMPIAGKSAAEMLRQQHAEIERLTAIIAKDGYAELWAECHTLRCEIKGPDGFETWKDAAVHERREKVKVKAEAKRLTKERDAAIAAAVAAEREEHAAEIDRLKRERHHIYDLLARIHRDGGQYAAEHGVEKACDDAESQVAAWLDTINSVDALIEQARIAEREAISAELRELADELGYGSSWWGPPGGLLLRAADMVSARGKS